MATRIEKRTADVSFGQFHVKWTSKPLSVGLLDGGRGIYLIQRFIATGAVQVAAVRDAVASMDVIGAGHIGYGGAW